MSDKVYRLYTQQVDRFHMEYPFEVFTQRSLALMSSALIDPHLTPAEYMKLCRHRAQLVIDHG